MGDDKTPDEVNRPSLRDGDPDSLRGDDTEGHRNKPSFRGDEGDPDSLLRRPSLRGDDPDSLRGDDDTEGHRHRPSFRGDDAPDELRKKDDGAPDSLR